MERVEEVGELADVIRLLSIMTHFEQLFISSGVDKVVTQYATASGQGERRVIFKLL